MWCVGVGGVLVNNMFLKVVIWVVIVFVLFMVFKQFDSCSMVINVKLIVYLDFIFEVKVGYIKDVIIEDCNIIVIIQDGIKVKIVIIILDCGLVGDLFNNGVKFDVCQLEEQFFLL